MAEELNEGTGSHPKDWSKCSRCKTRVPTVFTETVDGKIVCGGDDEHGPARREWCRLMLVEVSDR